MKPGDQVRVKSDATLFAGCTGKVVWLDGLKRNYTYDVVIDLDEDGYGRVSFKAEELESHP